MRMNNYIEEYIEINGIQQYFLNYPGESNTVVLFLHGGPGQTEAHFAYLTKDERVKCNFVYYDQRGTGKTQFKNKSKIESVTIETLLEDLKEIIVFIKEKYNTNKIILLGHSWGSILGTEYVKKYPKDVACYVGMGQVVDILRGEKMCYDKLGEIINTSKGKKDIKLYEKFEGYPYNLSEDDFTKVLIKFRKLQSKYGLSIDLRKAIKKILKSPVLKLTDIFPFLSGMKVNKNLMNLLLKYNIYDDVDYELPIYYICGRNDWLVPSVLVQEYFDKIQAPKKELFWIEDAGHLTNVDNSKEYNNAILKIIQEL